MTIDRHPPIIPGFPHLLHGGDWNPDQWLDQPQVIDEDFRLFALAGANALSLGIFSWTKLEAEEGRYDFVWMDRIMDRLANDGRKAILATPSGAKPAWMSLKYPEIRRVRDGKREPQYSRHNHCFTSPVFRTKVQAINTQLAERYAQHPALGAWHLSNEYSGDCQCSLCWDAFRTFVKTRYGDTVIVSPILPIQGTELPTIFNQGLLKRVTALAAQERHIAWCSEMSAITLAQLGDGVHPTAAGYTQMGDAWYAAIKAVTRGAMSADPQR